MKQPSEGSSQRKKSLTRQDGMAIIWLRYGDMPYHEVYFREVYPMSTTKVTVNLPDDTVENLKSIAQERGTTVTEALRQVIESQRFLQNEMQSGNKVLLQDPNDKSVRQVIFNTPLKSKANRA